MSTEAQVTSAFTVYHSGRLGDKIKATCKAKWLSHKYGLPFFYSNNEYFDELMISTLEKKYKGNRHAFKSSKMLLNEKKINIKEDGSTLYIIRNGTTLAEGSNICEMNDPAFKVMCKKLFAPIKPFQKMVLPTDKVSVAVHVRKGGGYDGPLYQAQTKSFSFYPDLILPLKFPPDQYYIDQITTVFELFENKPLYVHIFTDDSNPIAIVKRYKKALNNNQITFSCRTTKNTYKSNVLEDMFAMTDFECLIRPDSGLSEAAEFLGNHILVICPKSHRWEGHTLIIDMVTIKDRRNGTGPTIEHVCNAMQNA